MIHTPLTVALIAVCSASAQNVGPEAAPPDVFRGNKQNTFDGPVAKLGLDEALRLAEQHSPEIHAARADVAGTNASITSARAYPNPSADVLSGYQYQRLPDAIPGTLQHFGFSQRIDLPGRRSARINVAKIAHTSSEFALGEAQLRVRSAVKQAFYDVLRREAQVRLANDNLRLVHDLRRRIQVRVNVGEAGRLELTRADAELATAQASVRSANLRHVTALSTLRAVIGAPMTQQFAVSGSLDSRIDLPRLDALQTVVLSRHPLLKQAEAEVERAQAELRSQRAQRVPEPSVQAYYEHQPDLGFFEVGVSIPMPIWNNRQGPIAEARAAIERATAMRDYQRLQLTTGVESAYSEYQVADQQVLSLETGALREAQAALSGAEVAYKAGERGIIEVLDAQRVLRSVRLDYLNAQFDREAALISLERLRAVEVK